MANRQRAVLVSFSFKRMKMQLSAVITSNGVCVKFSSAECHLTNSSVLLLCDTLLEGAERLIVELVYGFRSCMI